MEDYVANFLVVLMTLLIGFCFGYMIGSMNRPMSINRNPVEPEPLGEHESNAPYPRFWE